MTMPHYMNCPHHDTGWCLACVAAEHERTEAVQPTEPVLDAISDALSCMSDGHQTTYPKSYAALSDFLARGRDFLRKGTP